MVITHAHIVICMHVYIHINQELVHTVWLQALAGHIVSNIIIIFIVSNSTNFIINSCVEIKGLGELTNHLEM